MTKTGSTSLRRLQNIDTLPSLNDRLREVGIILKNVHLGDADHRHRVDLHFVGGVKQDGRADWTARWILNQLQGDKVGAQEARANPEVWYLLGNIIPRLSYTSTTRIIHSTTILPAMINALQELKTSPFDSSGHGYPAQILQDKTSKLHRDGSDLSVTLKRKLEDDSSTSSAKRRKGKGYSDGSALPVILPPYNLYSGILHCLRSIIARSQIPASAHTSDNPEYTDSTLRTDTLTASRLLACFLEVSTSILQHRKTAERSRRPQHEPEIDLGPVLDVWNSRAGPAQDSASQFCTEFSKECLLPATLFLWTAKELPNHATSNRIKNVRSIERLIAKHIVLPARSTFHASKSNAPHQNMLAMHLSSLLSPLTSDSQSHVEADKFRSLAASKLFDLALRSHPLTSPKERSAESAWLNHLFLNLAMSIGYKDLAKGPHEVQAESSSTNLEALKSMLQIAIKRNVPIKSELLGAVLSRYAGLAAQGTPEWELVAQVMELDNSFFSTTRADKTEEETRVALLQNLVSQVTAYTWRTVNLDDTANLDSSRNDEYGLVRSKIVITLVKSFSASRRFLVLLEKWRDQLNKVWTQRHEGSAAGQSKTLLLSVWEDHQIADILSDAIETSITLPKLASFLEKLATLLDKLKLGDRPEPISDGSCGDLEMLSLVVHSLKSDSILGKLEEFLQRLFSTSIELLAGHRTHVAGSEKALWRLSSVLHQKLSNIGMLAGEKVLAKQVVQLATSKMRELRVPRHQSNFEWLNTMLAAAHGVVRDLELHNAVDEDDKVWITEFDVGTMTLLRRLQPLAESEIWSITMAIVGNLANSNRSTNLKPREIAETVAQWTVTSREAFLNWRLLSRRGDNRAKQDLQMIVECLDIVQTALMSSASPPMFEGTIGFLARIYSYLMPAVVPRKQREQFVDICVEFLSTRCPMDNQESLVQLLSAISRFLSTPCGNARIIKEMETVYDLGMRFDRMIEDQSSKSTTNSPLDESLDLFEHLASLVFSSRSAAASSTDLEGIGVMFERLFDASISARSSTCLRLAILRVLTAHIESIERTIGTGKPLDEAAVGIQSRLCEMLSQRALPLQNGLDENDTRQQNMLQRQEKMELLLLLKHMEGEALLKNEELLRNVVRDNGPGDGKGCLRRSGAIISESFLQFEIWCKMQAAKKAPVDVTLYMDQLDRANAGEAKSLNSIIKANFRSMNEEQFTNAFRDSLEATRSRSQSLGSMKLLRVLGAMLTELHQSNGSLLSEATAAVCERLTIAKELKQYRSAMDVFRLLQHDGAKNLSQYSVEVVLSSLSTVVANSGPVLPTYAAGVIYDRVCTVTRQILAIHRKKLRGRLGVVASLLQSLLRCLFVPNGASSGTSPLVTKRPPWLTAEYPLSRKQAEQFSRLLTMLCEPSASSVASRARSSQLLKDETRQARVNAGQHMSYILMEFCECQLHGALPDLETREQLMPGLFAACGAVELAGVQDAVMASLSAPARVTLKDLWEQWRRLGRWDGG